MNNSHEPESLSKKVIRGGLWVFFFRIVQQVFSFIRLVILARILEPNDFGLIGIALLTLAILETFSQTGFGAALVQKKHDIKGYLDVSWTITIIRGFVLFALLYFVAPYASEFFKAPEANLIIQIIGLSILLKAFINVGVVYFPKNLEFNKQFIYGLSAILADFVVAVLAALILRNAWALVFGCLAGNLTRLIVSYLIHPYRPRFSLDFGKAKELFGFGKWIWGSTILMFLLTQGDDIFVGKMLGVVALGFYQMAYRISNMVATEVADAISQVTFSAYSMLQDDPITLRNAFLKTLQVTIFISAPLAALVFIFAPEFTKIFLGDKWMFMVTAMQALAFVGLVKSIAATTSPIFLATNRPEVDTKLQLIQLLVLVTMIYPLSAYWGILGTSIAVLFSTLVATFGCGFMVVKITGCEFKSFGKMIVLPLLCSIIMMVVVIILKGSMQLIGFLELSLLIGAGVISYFFLMFLFDSLLNYGIREIIKKSIALL